MSFKTNKAFAKRITEIVNHQIHTTEADLFQTLLLIRKNYGSKTLIHMSSNMDSVNINQENSRFNIYQPSWNLIINPLGHKKQSFKKHIWRVSYLIKQSRDGK